jgi:hypothetical protein
MNTHTHTEGQAAVKNGLRRLSARAGVGWGGLGWVGVGWGGLGCVHMAMHAMVIYCGGAAKCCTSTETAGRSLLKQLP